MLADRCCALVARLVDMVQMAPVGVSCDRFDRDDFSRQRVGHIDRPRRRVGNAVAAMTEPGDGELLSHLAAPSRNSALPSPPAIGDGVMPRTRQPSAATNAAMPSQTAA